VSNIEKRFLATEESRIGLESETKKIRGYAAVFNTESNPLPGPGGRTFREVILPGAFDEVLESGSLDVIANYQHNDSDILGRSSNGTLRLSADERGLAIEIDPPDTTLGRDIRTLIERGDLGTNGAGCSFAFTVADGGDEWSSEGELRTIRKVSGLFDVAICTTPAYPSTEVAVRALERYLSEKEQYSNLLNNRSTLASLLGMGKTVEEPEPAGVSREEYRLFLAKVALRRARAAVRSIR
jgi:HK97 family phage prohead protease